MKIKRKEWAKLNAELIYLRKVIKGRIKILATDDRPLVDVDLEECYLAAKYGNNPSEIMQGPITFQITAPDQATGYDHFMVNKYRDDAPWNIINKLTLTDDSERPNTCHHGDHTQCVTDCMCFP
jgi:hypothetical protein